MPFTKLEKLEHYVVQLDDSGAVDVVTLRIVESVVDSGTGAPVSDTTAIVPVVNFSDGNDTPGAREGLVALRALIDTAIARTASKLRKPDDVAGESE